VFAALDIEKEVEGEKAGNSLENIWWSLKIC
jgi:hypothetical protein